MRAHAAALAQDNLLPAAAQACIDHTEAAAIGP